MTEIEVHAERPYRVRIEAGASAQLPELVSGAARVALLHPVVMADAVGQLARLLSDAGHRVTTIVLPATEEAKTVTTLSMCWDALAAAGFTRDDVIVGVGGGATTDVAGFVAASWLRGVPYVSVPTTVLGMVDAAVGGKTGINIAAGKNLVGAFYEPCGVLCDTDLLVGLPAAEVSSGLAEVVKCGFIADPRILDLVEQDPAESMDVGSIRFAELVRRAIAIKAAVVSKDLREATSTRDHVGREALNYGHTLGHAIEAAHHFSWRHGEAISVGMVFAAEVSHRLVGLPASVVRRHRDLLGAVGLPTVYNAAEWSMLRSLMSIDKKARGATLRLIGLREVGEVTVLAAPDEAVLTEAFATLAPVVV